MADNPLIDAAKRGDINVSASALASQKNAHTTQRIFCLLFEFLYIVNGLGEWKPK